MAQYKSRHTGQQIDDLLDRAGGTSNPNLLDNPWFTVNQRGVTSFTGGVYGADRWIGYICSVVNDGIAVGALGTLIQRIENLDALQGKTLTMSAMLPDGSVVSGTKVNFDKNEFTYFCIQNGLQVIWYKELNGFGIFSVNGNTIKAIKLELGTVSTLANDAPPNYAEELAKCQRYYQKITISYAFGHCATAQVAYVAVPLTCSIRTTPSITYNGGGLATIDGAKAVTIVALANYDNSMIYIGCGSSGLPVGTPACFHDSTITISADL